MGVDYIDHNRTDEIVCPWCGYQFSESYEFDGDSGDIECGNEGCEKPFFYEREMEPFYSTVKLDSKGKAINE